MLNQKGIAFIPILLWSAIVLVGGFVAQDAVQKGYISINVPRLEPKTIERATQSPIPSASLFPVPTPSVTSKVKVESSNSNSRQVQQSEIKHDGSRTGPIVDYYSYCEKKTIKIYENERIPFTTKDGKQVYSTKGDIDCYYKNISGTSTYTGSVNTYTPIPNSRNANEVTCSVTGYSQSRKVWTYILTPEECEATKAEAAQKSASLQNTSIDCTIAGQVVGKMTYEECSQKITEYYKAKTIPVQDTTVRDYNSAVSACLTRMRALGITSSSLSEACYTNPNLGL